MLHYKEFQIFRQDYRINLHYPELIAKYRKTLLQEYLLLVFTTLVCLIINKMHASAFAEMLRRT